MPLYDTEYTHALITAMACSLAAFLLCWLWNLVSAELHRHGAAKMFLFAALAVPLALWSVGKVGGGDPDGGAQTLTVGRAVDAYGRDTSLSRDGTADFIDCDPVDGSVAAISNAEAVATYSYDGIGNLATSIWNTAATTYSANEHVWIMERNGARWLSGFMDTGETMCLV